jgi:glyoxalase family protein
MGATPITGLHHITAFCGDPRINHRFYTGVLGLRFVKRTVNFDDPGTYHLYYGDGAGSPGTILTFFPWVGVPPGRKGTGQAVAVAFRAGEASLEWWKKRLGENKVAVRGPSPRLGETFIEFEDPDGLALEIVAARGGPPPTAAWKKSPVPAEHALRGFHTVAISEAEIGLTHALVTEVMGFRLVGDEKGRRRYEASQGGLASFVDILNSRGGRAGFQGNGMIHHIAFRVADDAAQDHWRNLLIKLGYNVSPVMDRTYFHSIYYREPGGVLFEIATDVPGFAFDEPMETLGEKLKLPPQFEGRRAEIVRHLPPL